jgi:hypothetical protein
LVLGALAFIVVVAAIWVARVNTADQVQSFGLLYPGLSRTTDDIKAIRVFQAGGQRVVEIKHPAADQWTVSERNDYPADPEKVRKLLDTLRKARVLEEKTSNPASYPALGVEDVNAADARGLRLEIDGKPAVNLIIGRRGTQSESRYVRRNGEAKSLLVNVGLSASAQPQVWLSSNLIDIAAERVHEVTLSIGTQTPFTATKASRDEANFTVRPLPPKRELKSPDVADGFASALVNLQLQDVRSREGFDPKSRANAAIVRTFDGLTLEVSGWGRDNAYFVTIEPRFDEALAKQYLTTPAPATDAKTTAPAVDPAASLMQTKNEAQKLATQLSPWVYQISETKYNALFKPIDQLLK